MENTTSTGLKSGWASNKARFGQGFLNDRQDRFLQLSYPSRVTWEGQSDLGGAKRDCVAEVPWNRLT